MVVSVRVAPIGAQWRRVADLLRSRAESRPHDRDRVHALASGR